MSRVLRSLDVGVRDGVVEWVGVDHLEALTQIILATAEAFYT